MLKISIITATYNSGKTLRDTIESVLSQTYCDFEHLIIDGGSKDNTLEIIKEYEPKYNGRLQWISEPDRGLYDAMNKGIRMASGNVIGILNSDDFYADSKVLEDISVAFTQNTDVVFGNLYFVDQNDTNKIMRIWKGSPYKSFKMGWHPAHPTFYARRQCFQKYGGFDTEFKVSADFELMLRFLEKEKLRSKYIDRYFVKMRLGGESTGDVRNIIKGNKNIVKAFKKNGINISPLYPLYRFFPKLISLIKFRLGLVK